MIYERTLPNGLELIIYPTTAPVASVFAWVDVGSVDERPNEAGWCHFLEHMLFKGTKKRTTSDIAGAVEGAGGEMNAFTSFEYTAYHITLSNQKWKLANEILADMVLGSVFKPNEFKPEKEVILEEIKRGDDSPDRRLYQGLYKQFWGGVGYGRPVIGYPKTVKACTANALKSFWKRWYSPELMTVVVCGDVDVTAVEAEILKTWGKAKSKAPRKRRRVAGYKSNFVSGGVARDHLVFPVNSIRYAAASPAVSLSSPKLAAIDVATTILGSGESSRLHQRLYRKDQVVTGVSCSVWAPFAEGLLSFDIDAPLEKASAFLRPLWQEVTEFARSGPTVEELERAKTQLESERVYGTQSMENLAYRFGYMKLSTGDARFDLNYLSQVRDATAEDVRAAIAELLEQGGLRENILVPKDFNADLVWSDKAPTPYTINSAVKSQTKNSAAGKSGTKQKDEKHPLSSRLVSLSNGIDLVLLRRDDVPVVSVQASFMGGLRFENSKQAGLGALMADVWDKAPKGWTAEHTSQYLESRASRIGAFSGRNSTGLSASTLTRYVDDVMPVFCDMLFAPAFDIAEVERERSVQLEDLKTFDDQPTRLADKLFCESLFESHPYSWPVSGRTETVSGFDVNTIKNHYAAISGARVVIAVAGKFNEDKIIKSFDGIKRSNLKNIVQKPQFTEPKSLRFVEVAKNREQSHIIHGCSGLSVNDQDRIQLRAMLTLLGGQSGRLFTELRDKQGLCYVVSAFSFEGIEPGYFAVYMGCDPKKREQALLGIQNELFKLAEKAVKPAELLRAKEFLLGRHHMDLQLNSALSSLMSLNTLYGLGHNDHLSLATQLKAVTPASLKRFAADLLNRPPVTAVVI